MSQQPFKVAVIQASPVFLNLEATLDKAEGLIEQAATAGAQVIAFPETWLPGYPVWLDDAPNAGLWDHPPAKALFQLLVDNSPTIPGPHLDRLKAMAKQAGVYLIMGMHERDKGTLYNTTLFLDRDGEHFAYHRKLVPTYTERMVWGRGDGSTLSTLDTEFGVIGGLICWEHWMPMARAAMHSKSEVLHIAQWPMVKDPLHQICSRHYAFEGQCFVIAAGAILSKGDMLDGFDSLEQPGNLGKELLESMPGDRDTLIHRGGCSIIAPDLSYLVEPVYDKADILYAELDPRLIAEGHLALDTDGHYSRPDVFQLHVNDQPQTNVRFSSSKNPDH